VLERALTLSRGPSKNDSFDTDIFVKIRPMNSFSSTDEAPVVSFLHIAVQKARKPRQRDSNRAAIIKIYSQAVIGNGNGFYQCWSNLNR